MNQPMWLVQSAKECYGARMSFVGEIKRRKVFQVAAVYAVVAWLLVQIVATIEAPLNLPDWADTLVIVLLAIGFPIALIISWAFDLTPDGLVRDLGDNPQFRGKGRRVEYVLIALLAVAVGFLFMDNYVLDRAPDSSVDSVSLESPDSAAASSGRRVLENSVAVLPFENVSPNPDDAYFATGLHEEVLIQLSKLSNLSVISRTSVLRYADSDLTIPEIARELNVGTVMEGSVRYAGNRIRITAELIDAETDRNLWGETYDREFNDIFAIESDIAMNVANALEAEFSPEEQRALEQTPTSEPAAYAFYLRARNFLTGNLGTEAAHAALDRAIEIDSGFANAYALKALLYAASLVNTAQGTGVAAEERDALEGRVRDFAQQALDLDLGNAIARDALRSIFIVTWRWSAFEQAVEPGDEVAFSPAALWTYAWMGKRDEAVRLGQRRAELDPNDVEAHLNLGVVYAYAGDYKASMRSFEEAHALSPENPLVQAWKAYDRIALGETDAAAAELRLLEQLLGDIRPIVFLPELAYAYARIGRRDDVTRIVDEIELLENPDELGAGAWAVTYLAMGDEARALEQLEIVAEKTRSHEPDAGYYNVMNLKMNYLADPVLEKPAFVDALGRIRGD
jgi:adenylate cyclase